MDLLPNASSFRSANQTTAQSHGDNGDGAGGTSSVQHAKEEKQPTTSGFRQEPVTRNQPDANSANTTATNTTAESDKFLSAKQHEPPTQNFVQKQQQHPQVPNSSSSDAEENPNKQSWADDNDTDIYVPAISSQSNADSGNNDQHNHPISECDNEWPPGHAVTNHLPNHETIEAADTPGAISVCDEWPPGLSFVQNEHRQSLLLREQQQQQQRNEEGRGGGTANVEEEIVFSPEDAKDDFFDLQAADSSHSLSRWINHKMNNNNHSDGTSEDDDDDGVEHSAQHSSKLLLDEEVPTSAAVAEGTRIKPYPLRKRLWSNRGPPGRRRAPWFRRKYIQIAAYSLGILVVGLVVGIYVLFRGGGGGDEGGGDNSNGGQQLGSQSQGGGGGPSSSSPPTEPPISAQNSASSFPSPSPTFVPSGVPSLRPALGPTFSPWPTASPSHTPSSVPSLRPTQSLVPTGSPSLLPSKNPTVAPSGTPSTAPTISAEPSQSPTADGMNRLNALLPQYTLDVLEINNSSSAQVMAHSWMAADPNIDLYEDFRLLQRFSLATFFYATGGNDGAWSAFTDWLSYSAHECDWVQVYPSHMSSSTHPPCSAQKEFMSIVLAGNGLSGELPLEVGLLTSLVTFDMESNSLVGPLPSTLGELTLLTKIGVENNGLTGPIPSEIGRLTDMDIFDLNNNQFSGFLPEELGNLVNVRYFLIQGSNLQGGIPTSYRNQTSVVSADLSGASLSGPLDEKLWWTNAFSIDLSNNAFTEAFPTINSDGFFSDLQQLTTLSLLGNQLTGNLPTQIGTLNNLRYLYLNGNPLEGALPSELALLRDLQRVQIYDTSISGSVPLEVCDHIAELGFELAITCRSLSCDCACQCMLESHGLTPSSDLIPLGKCEGDCDSDSECEAGLRCWQRDNLDITKSVLVPGCYGAGVATWDYCYEPIDAPVDLAQNTAADKGICQGPCSTDDDCFGDDLKCFTRSATEAVPGCTGVGVSGQGYCYFEQPSPSLRAMGKIGNELLPEGTFPLGECFGECDYDGDCAKGLECFQRDEWETISGCFGLGINSGRYCHDPASTLFVDVRREVDSKHYCMDISEGDTTNTNAVNLWSGGCDAHDDANARWYWGGDGHVRSALDYGKCIVGSAGDVTLGTILMIYDCWTGDSRFLYAPYSDGTIRPKSNSRVCVGAEVGERLQLKDCSDSSTQGWEFVVFPSNLPASVAKLHWVPQGGQPLFGVATGDQFGESVALSETGNTVAVGADVHGRGSGHVRVFQWNGTEWDQIGDDIDGDSPDDWFGRSTAMSSNGTVVVSGAPNAGAGYARVVAYNGYTWSKMGQNIQGEVTGDYFGQSVAISHDGMSVAAGAPLNDNNGDASGSVGVFKYNGTEWNKVGQDLYGEAQGDYFGYSVSLSADSTVVAGGAIYSGTNGAKSGYAQVHKYNGTNWVPFGQTLKGVSGSEFGHSVSLSANGTILVVGAWYHDSPGVPRSGQVSCFHYDSASLQWLPMGDPVDGVNSFEYFGESVAVSADGTRFVAGAAANNDGGTLVGQIRAYEWGGEQWVQIGQAANGEEDGGEFGYSVAMSGDGNVIAGGGNKGDAGHANILKWFGP